MLETPKSMNWRNNRLYLLDQTKLPLHEEYIECTDYQRVAEAIRKLEVRGAPAIGAAAAYAVVLAQKQLLAEGQPYSDRLIEMATELKATRPTAVNLAWAVNRIMKVWREEKEHCTGENLLKRMEMEAAQIAAEDQAVNEKMAEFGAGLFNKPTAVLTHCNAGALATVAVGTALGVIGKAWTQGKITRVYADETRPLLQGSRLTAFELSRMGVPTTLITDNMAAWVMKTGRVQAVIVGADRISRNGDVANKIGTYGLAVLAKVHDIPFYVAAPSSSFDLNIETGAEIPIEERSSDEIFCFGSQRTAPEGIEAFNPAFDVTPAKYISAIITERGLLYYPYDNLPFLMTQSV